MLGAYGSPYNAYKLQFTDFDGSWYVYVVPGVGIVRGDEFDENPPHILILTDIRTCDYSVLGDLNRDCKIDLNDFVIIVSNWLLDCELNPSDPTCISLQ